MYAYILGILFINLKNKEQRENLPRNSCLEFFVSTIVHQHSFVSFEFVGQITDFVTTTFSQMSLYAHFYTTNQRQSEQREAHANNCRQNNAVHIRHRF